VTNVNPPSSTSAAMHAERVRAGEAERAGRAPSPSAQSTAERYAARILPGYRADAELREQARLRELQARGVITADAEPEDVDEEEDFEVEVDEEEGDEEAAQSTAERYAARERARIKVEREANKRAWAGSTWQHGERLIG